MPADDAVPDDGGRGGLAVLVVDDELPAREELGYLLGLDPRVAAVTLASSGAAALRELEERRVDVVFLDIAMPGLSGLELARVLTHYREPPAVVFVTAHDEHAVQAFELNVVDYVLKPVRAQRVSESLRRVVDGASHVAPPGPPDETIPVELGGITTFVRRSEVRYVESHGDYTRLHTPGGRHLVRTSMTELQERWHDAGFVRIHRQALVALAHISQLRQDGNHMSVVVDGTDLVVARRHRAELRDLLLRRAGQRDDPSHVPSSDASAADGPRS